MWGFNEDGQTPLRSAGKPDHERYAAWIEMYAGEGVHRTHGVVHGTCWTTSPPRPPTVSASGIIATCSGPRRATSTGSGTPPGAGGGVGSMTERDAGGSGSGSGGDAVPDSFGRLRRGAVRAAIHRLAPRPLRTGLERGDRPPVRARTRHRRPRRRSLSPVPRCRTTRVPGALVGAFGHAVGPGADDGGGNRNSSTSSGRSPTTRTTTSSGPSTRSACRSRRTRTPT